MFTDASPDLERAITRGSGSNCCVTFKSSRTTADRERAKVRKVVVFAFLVVMLVFFGVWEGVNITSAARQRGKANLDPLSAEAKALKLD